MDKILNKKKQALIFLYGKNNACQKSDQVLTCNSYNRDFYVNIFR